MGGGVESKCWRCWGSLGGGNPPCELALFRTFVGERLMSNLLEEKNPKEKELYIHR